MTQYEAQQYYLLIYEIDLYHERLEQNEPLGGLRTPKRQQPYQNTAKHLKPVWTPVSDSVSVLRTGLLMCLIRKYSTGYTFSAWRV